jgi:hypothetical protein
MSSPYGEEAGQLHTNNNYVYTMAVYYKRCLQLIARTHQKPIYCNVRSRLDSYEIFCKRLIQTGKSIGF